MRLRPSSEIEVIPIILFSPPPPPHTPPVLEFELRKANETIKSLRGSLTEATGKCCQIRVITAALLWVHFKW